jgi:hypothetical protein
LTNQTGIDKGCFLRATSCKLVECYTVWENGMISHLIPILCLVGRRHQGSSSDRLSKRTRRCQLSILSTSSTRRRCSKLCVMVTTLLLQFAAHIRRQLEEAFFISRVEEVEAKLGISTSKVHLECVGYDTLFFVAQS